MSDPALNVVINTSPLIVLFKSGLAERFPGVNRRSSVLGGVSWRSWVGLDVNSPWVCSHGQLQDIKTTIYWGISSINIGALHLKCRR